MLILLTILNVGGVNIMRDKNRIDPFIKKVVKYWKQNPDLRFGQVVSIIERQLGSERDIFYVEENELEIILDKLIS